MAMPVTKPQELPPSYLLVYSDDILDDSIWVEEQETGFTCWGQVVLHRPRPDMPWDEMAEWLLTQIAIERLKK